MIDLEYPETVSDLKSMISGGRDFNYISYYYGSMVNPIFSHYCPWEFEYSDHKFFSAEQAIMFMKAHLFKDVEIMKLIAGEKNAHKCKMLGRKVSGFEQVSWDAYFPEILREVNVAKFSSTEKMKSILASTGYSVLVEANPYDKTYGVGLAHDDERVSCPEQWQGKNCAGFGLMAAREEIISNG